jgi:hypothetical protein
MCLVIAALLQSIPQKPGLVWPPSLAYPTMVSRSVRHHARTLSPKRRCLLTGLSTHGEPLPT